MTIETPFWFGDTRVVRLSRADAASREAVVLFHGFPGQPPKGQEDAYKNVPRLRLLLGAALADAGIDAYLPGYEGVGESRGRWSFARSVERSRDLALDLAARHERLHVGGHSWGGFVAPAAHRGLGARAGRLALFAGLLDLPDRASILRFLPEYQQKYPEILGAGPEALAAAVDDLDRTRLAYNPHTHAAPAAADALLLVHGRQDTYVDVELSRRYHRKAGGRFLEIDDDHLFLQRMPDVVAEAASFFAGRLRQ
jgi:alpha-beta hydrolase superfamily lysophospholipase